MTEAATVKSAAHLWRARHDEGLTSAEQQEFDHWLASDQANREAFLESEILWENLAQLDFADAIPAEDTALSEAKFDFAAWLRSFFEPLYGFGGRAIAATVAIALVGGAVFLTMPSGLDGNDTASAVTQYATAEGQSQRIRLPDGSTILLKSSSTIEVEYSDGLRQVRLASGSALFDVANDPARPFVASSQFAQVIVTGTNFVMTLRNDGLEVKVREGSVDVAPADLDPAALEQSMRTSLIAGEAIWTGDGREVFALEATSASDQVSRAIPAAQVTTATPQQEPRTYRSAPLSQVVDDLNRVPGVSIRLDPSAADLTVSGTFQGDDPMGVLSTIEAALPVTISQVQGHTVIKRK